MESLTQVPFVPLQACVRFHRYAHYCAVPDSAVHRLIPDALEHRMAIMTYVRPPRILILVPYICGPKDAPPSPLPDGAYRLHRQNRGGKNWLFRTPHLKWALDIPSGSAWPYKIVGNQIQIDLRKGRGLTWKSVWKPPSRPFVTG